MRRVDQLSDSRLRIGMFMVACQVLLVITPALIHWLEKPVAVGCFTGRICRSMTALAYERLNPIRRANSKSPPSSNSRLISGFRLGLPRLAGLKVPPAPSV